MKLQSEQDFINNIGKTIYRGPVSCKCRTCEEVEKNGTIVYNEEHAKYLNMISNDCQYDYYTTKGQK